MRSRMGLASTGQSCSRKPGATRMSVCGTARPGSGQARRGETCDLACLAGGGRGMSLADVGAEMSTLMTDLRVAVRMLWKDRRFTLVALVALALGIGATSAIYTVIDSVLLRPLPFPEPNALVEIQSAGRNGAGPSSFADFVDYRGRNRSLESTTAYLNTTLTLTGNSDPLQLEALAVTPNFLHVLGVQPMMGRAFTDADAVVGSQAVILAHAFWQGRYRGDPDIIGRTLSLDGRPAIVVGVMPATFHFPLDGGDATPLVYVPFPREEADLSMAKSRGMHAFAVVGRAAAGTTSAQVQADLDAVAATMRADHPAEGDDKNLTLHATPLRERIVGPVRPALILLLCAVFCVLVIACANVAGLLLARATVRRREVAIRSTLGATRGRIVRQLLTESALIGIVGGGAGILLALWLIDLLLALVTPSLPQLHDVTIDGRVLAVTAAVSLLSSVAFGLVPALQASRVDLQESLKESTRSASHVSRRSRNALLVAEIAVALVLLFGAGLTLRSFAKLRRVDTGFRPDGLVLAQVEPPSSRYPRDEDCVTYYRRLQAALETLPGVESFGTGGPLPFSHASFRTSVHLVGQPPSPALSAARVQAVSPSYLAAMGIPLVRGRNLSSADDDKKSAAVVVVSQEFARKLFPGEEAIGKHIAIGMTSFEDKNESTDCEDHRHLGRHPPRLVGARGSAVDVRGARTATAGPRRRGRAHAHARGDDSSAAAGDPRAGP